MADVFSKTEKNEIRKSLEQAIEDGDGGFQQSYYNDDFELIFEVETTEGKQIVNINLDVDTDADWYEGTLGSRDREEIIAGGDIYQSIAEGLYPIFRDVLELEDFTLVKERWSSMSTSSVSVRR